jgi:hypothetical protein
MMNESAVREFMVSLIRDIEEQYTRSETYRGHIQVCQKLSMLPDADFEERCRATRQRGAVKERIGQKFSSLYDVALQDLSDKDAQAILDRIREMFEDDSSR